MKNRFCITTAELILAVGALVPAFAHGGFDHIRGTVARVANNVLTVKTAHGNVDVKLDNRTSLIRNGRKALVSDLKSGARVIAEVPQGSKDHVAQSVQIGRVPQAMIVIYQRTESRSCNRTGMPDGRNLPQSQRFRFDLVVRASGVMKVLTAADRRQRRTSAITDMERP